MQFPVPPWRRRHTHRRWRWRSSPAVLVHLLAAAAGLVLTFQCASAHGSDAPDYSDTSSDGDTSSSSSSSSTLSRLRTATVALFYHGYDNYMAHAFPEDELRPLSCAPLTRDRADPAHVELNDVLGNYSLTLIDSLSTLAVLASAPPPLPLFPSSSTARSATPDASLERKRSERRARAKTSARALRDFKSGVQALVAHYGDGSAGPAGAGSRARGFDLDSKVQVFETVIRGVGGLLSAHLFAVGELPIRGYVPKKDEADPRRILWESGFVYDGQLLRLAKDLGERLLPAFVTDTKIPYPRVNLRHGVPFYANSPLNRDSPTGLCPNDAEGRAEITETCSAGAGSLVLEFTTLSRLTGDARFELAAKEAFWAVWHRRSAIGLIGAGIDAETGRWITPYTGIGAGIDSFFEYAFKSHILLSGLPFDQNASALHSSDAFLDAWKQSHEAIKRNIYRGDAFHHPHYIQTDVYTGAARAFWIDSLSAYYPGLLALSGEAEEATASHLLYTALWSRYAALPERWSTHTGDIEQGLRWWGGRPEFVESAWYLYRATKDPWYLHVGEMVLKDIKRRCWTKCGWAGLQDVQTGEKTDRMESFFLGETAKYLYLLFDEDHPLNTWDAPFVFTTEGHPLIVPRSGHQTASTPSQAVRANNAQETCPVAPSALPLTISNVAARGDVFHAAALARIDSIDTGLGSAGEVGDFYEHSNLHPVYNTSLDFFPWTLSRQLVPANGTCQKMMNGMTFDLSFPNYAETPNPYEAIHRVQDGILLTSLSGVRLGMVRESDDHSESYRIYSLLNVALGRDEKVYIGRDVVSSFNPQDPYFTRSRDVQMLDLIVDAYDKADGSSAEEADLVNSLDSKVPLDMSLNVKDLDSGSLISSLVQSIQLLLRDSPDTIAKSNKPSVPQRFFVGGSMPTGQGAASFHTIDQEVADLAADATDSPLSWKDIYIATHDLCSTTLDASIPRTHQIIVVARGGCSFATKLQHIPTFPPTAHALQLVIVISHPLSPTSYSRDWALSPRSPPATNRPAHLARTKGRHAPAPAAAAADPQIQPLLQDAQLTPAGMPRAHPIPMVLVDGGAATVELLRRAKGVAVRRRWWYDTQGLRIENLVVL